MPCISEQSCEVCLIIVAAPDEISLFPCHTASVFRPSDLVKSGAYDAVLARLCELVTNDQAVHQTERAHEVKPPQETTVHCIEQLKEPAG